MPPPSATSAALPLDADLVLVGGYTAEMGGRARGIGVFVPGTDPAGRLAFRPVAGPEATSPSYLVAHPHAGWVFAGSEAEPGAVSSYAVRADGRLSEIGRVPTGGSFTCHLAVSPDGNRLVAADYGSGSVTGFSVRADGTLVRSDRLAFTGSGPDAERQDAPHAHQAVWDHDRLLVCDLGTDRVHRLRVEVSGRFRADPAVELPAGAGPRHCVVVGDLLVVGCELNGEIWVGHRSGDSWVEIQRLRSSERAGPNQVSAVVTDGRTVFAANRGPDTISTFRCGSASLTREGEFASGGRWPRDLTLAAGLLWVANQNDDRVAAFPLAAMAPAGPAFTIPAPTPTCVLPWRGPRAR